MFISAAAQWDNWKTLALDYQTGRDAAITQAQSTAASAQAALAMKDEALAAQSHRLTGALDEIRNLKEQNAKLLSNLSKVENERLAFEAEMGSAPARFYQGQGCNFCADTGYRGRVGVFEVLTISESIRRMVVQGAGADEIKAQAIAEGMVPMRRDGMLKVQQGVTTPREVMRSVYTIR